MLPRSLDVTVWKEQFSKGAAPDKTPYGYHFAEDMGVKVTFSLPSPTHSGLVGFVDKVVKRLLGFDIRHAWRNRKSLQSDKFDVIWTHTEYEHLAIAVLCIFSRKKTPPVVAQSVWLIDEWDRYSCFKKFFYRHLLKHAAVATFHSSKNKEISEQKRIAIPAKMILFGISLDSFPLGMPALKFESNRPIRVLALGTDRHRDWKSLYDAVGSRSEFDLRVGTARWPNELKAPNIQVSLMTYEQVRAAYDWADCVVVPLMPNLHASGITTILEAVALGIPVVATLTGGLEVYFDADVVTYVTPEAPSQIREAILTLSCSPAVCLARVILAQEQLITRELTTRGFAKRHVMLTERLLSMAAP